MNQLCSMLGFQQRMTTFAGHIKTVLGWRSGEKVSRVAARGIVTVMANPTPLRNRTIRDLIRDTMSVQVAIVCFEHAIAPRQTSDVWPTRIGAAASINAIEDRLHWVFASGCVLARGRAVFVEVIYRRALRFLKCLSALLASELNTIPPALHRAVVSIGVYLAREYELAFPTSHALDFDHEETLRCKSRAEKVGRRSAIPLVAPMISQRQAPMDSSPIISKGGSV
jgi:hypothetical protein